MAGSDDAEREDRRRGLPIGTASQQVHDWAVPVDTDRSQVRPKIATRGGRVGYGGLPVLGSQIGDRGLGQIAMGRLHIDALRLQL